MRIDVQSHITPEWFLKLLAGRRSSPRIVGKGKDRILEVGPWRGRIFPKLTDITLKLEQMDAAGIDITVLSQQMPGPEMVGKDGPAAARRMNDTMAAVCRKYPDRFVGLCTLPLQDMKAAMQELTRCMEKLDMRGALLYSNVAGRMLDEPRFAPLFARAEAESIPLFLHPTLPVVAPHTAAYDLTAGVGFMFDTTLAAIRLIMNGTFERHPRLQFVLPHTGGTLPYIIGRIDHQVKALGRGAVHIRKAPSEYLKMMWTDTVAPGPLNLDFALKFWGADRILFASDHPWLDIQPFVDLVENAGLAAADKTKIYETNARKLFGIG
jgi:predicted TIM-barrel fold metal-dependent hydrolase